MRDLLLVCFSLILTSAPLWTQSGNQEKYSVSGTVVNSTDGQPVRGALVELIGADRKSALTGPDGHFEIDGATGGYASILARRPGFDQGPPAQRINISENRDGITLKLNPLARISGRIVDSDGDPIEGVGIQCMLEQIVNGRKQWQPHGGTNTDEGGNFLLEDLKPGAYLFSTYEKQLYMAQPKSEAARLVFRPMFYPDSPTGDLAQRIELAPGQEMKIDMTLHSVRGARVSVTTVPPTEVMGNLVPEDQKFSFGRGDVVRTGQSGSLVFPAVAPGSWKITARGIVGMRARAANEEQTYGELQVEVGGADIDNLKLSLNKLADIPVTVSGVQNAQVMIQLSTKDGMAVGATSPDADGQMKIRSVPPGRYRVVAPFMGSNVCLTSMLSGSQDLMREELVVTAGTQPPPIQIIVNSNCAQLTISANTKDAFVAVISSDGAGFEPRTLGSGNNSPVVSNLGAGDYKIYAFDDLAGLEYANPEVMREFKSQSVHLELGQKTSVPLEVNERHSK
jgi:hypothetical protein